VNLLQRASQRLGRKGLTINGHTSSGPWADSPFWDLQRARYNWLSPTSLAYNEETIENDFEGYLSGAFKGNGPVFSLMLVRLQIFSEARFQFRQLRHGRGGKLFGTPALNLLENPWPGGTTGDLLARIIAHADLAGNAYVTKVKDQYGERLRLLRPDWVTIISESASDPSSPLGGAALDARVVAYVYEPRVAGRVEPTILLPEQVAHFAPIPDPEFNWRGMSWLTPVLREITADNATTKHKLKFFSNAATPNLSISLDASVKPAAFTEFVEAFLEAHQGTDNAHKPLIIGGGADVKPLTFNFRDLDFKALQGGGETRLASAAGVPPVIVGFSEGLQGSSLNQGNYAAARRRFADGTMRPLWRNIAGSLARLVDVPADAELWIDERDIAFLREDRKDAAEIAFTRAQTIRQYAEIGYTLDSARDAVAADDETLLVDSGVRSVQLQDAQTAPAPDAGPDDEPTEPATEQSE
jgi:HK97 family phage portal protein